MLAVAPAMNPFVHQPAHHFEQLTREDLYELLCWLFWFMHLMKDSADVTSLRHPLNNVINYLAFALGFSSAELKHHKEVCQSMFHGQSGKRMYDLFFAVYRRYAKDNAYREHLNNTVWQKLWNAAQRAATKRGLPNPITPTPGEVDRARRAAIKDHDDSFSIVQDLLHPKLLKFESSDPSVRPLSLGPRKGRKRTRDGEELKKKKKLGFKDLNQHQLYHEELGLVGKPQKKPSKALLQTNKEEEARAAAAKAKAEANKSKSANNKNSNKPSAKRRKPSNSNNRS